MELSTEAFVLSCSHNLRLCTITKDVSLFRVVA